MWPFKKKKDTAGNVSPKSSGGPYRTPESKVSESGKVVTVHPISFVYVLPDIPPTAEEIAETDLAHKKYLKKMARESARDSSDEDIAKAVAGLRSFVQCWEDDYSGGPYLIGEFCATIEIDRTKFEFEDRVAGLRFGMESISTIGGALRIIDTEEGILLRGSASVRGALLAEFRDSDLSHCTVIYLKGLRLLDVSAVIFRRPESGSKLPGLKYDRLGISFS